MLPDTASPVVRSVTVTMELLGSVATIDASVFGICRTLRLLPGGRAIRTRGAHRGLSHEFAGWSTPLGADGKPCSGIGGLEKIPI